MLMDEWMNRWMGGWMDDELVDKCGDGLEYICTGYIKRWMDG